MTALRVGDTEVATYVEEPDLDIRLAPRPHLHPVRTLTGTVVTDSLCYDHPWHMGASVTLADVAGVNLWGGRTYVRDEGYIWLDDHGRIRHLASLGFAEHLAHGLDQLHAAAAEARLAAGNLAAAGVDRQLAGRRNVGRQDEVRAAAALAEPDLLELHPAEVQDTLSFYGFFRDERAPLGKHRLWVCRSISCMLRGGEELLVDVCRKLGVKPGQTTADGNVTVEFAECLGMCEGAPCVLMDDECHGCMTLEKTLDLIRRRGDTNGQV